jgi:hypothetical protein
MIYSDAMSWLQAGGFERRPMVVIEDHLYHTTDLLAALAASRPDLLESLTVCSLAQPGPDTSRTVARWLDCYGRLQVAAPTTAAALGLDRAASARLHTIGESPYADATACARTVAGLLRPGGVLLQDVQLSTLRFVPADRWWESIYLAATVRGMFADRPPVVGFLSNKRGYAATFGRDLLEAGFDPRGVMDKAEAAAVVVPTVGGLVDRQFPCSLSLRWPGAERRRVRVGNDAGERFDVDTALDLVLWNNGGSVTLAGRAVAEPRANALLSLRPDGHEAGTWSALVEDRLTGSAGVAVLAVGRRMAPPGAERAEVTNIAARHVHALRNRLHDPAAIVTRHHAYRLDDTLAVGCVTSVRDRPAQQGRA